MHKLKLIGLVVAMTALNAGLAVYTLSQPKPPLGNPVVATTMQACASDQTTNQTVDIGAVAMGSLDAAIASKGASPDRPIEQAKHQAFFDASQQQKIIRVGIQKTDCGCCGALQEELKKEGFDAKFSYITPTNAINITEHIDRCRMVSIDGVPFAGYNAQELSKIVGMKFRGDMPGHLASTLNYQGIDPREARPLPGERSLIVIEQQRNVGGQ